MGQVAEFAGAVRCAEPRRYLTPELDRLCAAAMTTDDVVTPQGGGRVRPLEWDSQFFGVPAGRLELLWRRTGVPPQEAWDRLVPALVGRADDAGIAFLDARIAADELALAQALEASGFRLVDGLAMYLRDLRGRVPIAAPPHPGLDIEAFLREALADMVWGRVFAEKRVARARAEEFYLRTSLHYLGQGAAVTVLEEAGGPAGLAIGVVDAEGSRLAGCRLGFLWLFIVAPRHKGRGLGKRLFNQFCDEFATVVDVVEIGTQIQHVAANRIYRSAGDAPVAHALTFHRWRG